MLIVGISYKLIPMFTLSDIQSVARARASIILLNVGLAGSFITILLRSPWKLLFAVVVIAGLVIYGWEMRSILKARKRRALDWGLKYFLTAVSVLGALAMLAVVLSWPGLPLTAFTGQLENLYGYGAVLGVVTFAILGMLYKILPFLVWYGTYSRHIGASRVPSLADLYSSSIQAAQFVAYLAALVVAGAGIVTGSSLWVRIGFILFAAAFGLFALNAVKMLSHLFRPRIQPLTAPSAFARKA
jgi:MFS family permease